MGQALDIDTLRRDAILAGLAGFPFLLVFAGVWTAAGALSYVLPTEMAAWAYVLLGLPAMPIAIALERRVGYVRSTGSNPLLPLTLQVLFIQIVAFPAILLVWDQSPHYVPVAFAAIVGAHFLPFQWIYQTRVYGVIGVLVAVGPFVLVVIVRAQALHLTGFLVGGILLVGACLVRAHARAVWRETQAMAPRTSAGSSNGPR